MDKNKTLDFCVITQPKFWTWSKSTHNLVNAWNSQRAIALRYTQVIHETYKLACVSFHYQLGYGEDMIHPSLDMTTTCNEKAKAITLAENKRFMNKGR